MSKVIALPSGRFVTLYLSRTIVGLEAAAPGRDRGDWPLVRHRFASLHVSRWPGRRIHVHFGPEHKDGSA